MTVQKLSISEYASNLQQYTDNVSEEVVKGIVKHLGIALTNRDASLVSCSDKTELDRIREGVLMRVPLRLSATRGRIASSKKSYSLLLAMKI